MLGSKGAQVVNTSQAMKAGERVMANFVAAEAFTTNGGKDGIKFKFDNATGTVAHAIFNDYDVDINNITDPTKKKMAENDKNNCYEKLLHIVAALLPREKMDEIKAANFKDLCEQYIKHVNFEAKGTEVFLHVVVNQKSGYVDLPKFRNCISSAHNECSWTSDPRYHSYTRPNVSSADVEKTTTAAVGAPAKPKLPF